VREDGRIVSGEGWQEKVHNREEWKKLLRMARNRRILHRPMKWAPLTSLKKKCWVCMPDTAYLNVDHTTIYPVGIIRAYPERRSRRL